MQPLEKSLRNSLERTVKSARDIAEAAARAALEQLGVGEATAFAHLSETERELRRKLRVHSRQLGDARNAQTETQDIDRLLEEVAYEHWHRMLFARFLAENNLLMYPDPNDPVAVTLEECEDLAVDEGAANGWELAARFAAHMLPQIFRPDSPVFQLALPPEHQQKLERLVTELPRETFTASDSLGWVYQFWQANNKDRINKSEVKIGARELPAVTQLFTEPYMVSFLLDNSLGAWWAARRLSETDLRNASSEEELRNKAAIPGVSLEYLRFVQQGDDSWTPAAGTFDKWPGQLSELKTLDPCCGSGHFLVAAFLMLVPMRMEQGKLSARDAVDAVLSENIHGLELDQRCVELAAFALALTAWKFPGAGGYRPLPALNLACSGLAISAKKEEWLALAGDNTNLNLALEELYKQFKDAPMLGSLINPKASFGKESLFELKWEEVGPLLTKALAGENDDEKTEMGVVAKGISHAAMLLGEHYKWIITNVPYLGMRRMNEKLYQYCDKQYPLSKQDIATVFIDRFRELSKTQTTISLVSPQNWLVQPAYDDFRGKFLEKSSLRFIAQLGENGFDSPQAAGAFVSLSIFDHHPLQKAKFFSAIKALQERGPEAKAEAILQKRIKIVDVESQYKNPQHKISFEDHGNAGLIENFAIAPQGIKTGDDERWVKCFWEITKLSSARWEYAQSSVNCKTFFGGRDKVLNWSTGGEGMIRPRLDSPALNKWGVAISQTRNKAATIYTGQLFLSTLAPVVPYSDASLSTLWEYCSSADFREAVTRISPGLFATNSSILVAPIEFDHWEIKTKERFPYGLPKPYSNDPTQWIFHGHPCGSVVWDDDTKWTTHGSLRTDDTVLQVAVARLLGYRWPAELDSRMELADQQREWVKRCEALLSFSDEDGIVCLPPVRGEASAADRLLNLLAAAYGDTWSNDILAQLLNSADHASKTMETWLREKFFTQHCKLFQQRPFIWHIWDGLRDGFAALINYHKLDAKLLEALIYTYLGDWISRQKQDINNGVDGAQEKLAAAESLKKKLELILEGEAPYDIFVRWKPLEEQPIGWNPDLNDGIRLNIRPFMSAPDVGKRGAGVLRDKPNIKWEKDRGKDVESAPWYYLFAGDRINDHHLKLEDKLNAKNSTKSREI